MEKGRFPIFTIRMINDGNTAARHSRNNKSITDHPYVLIYLQFFTFIFSRLFIFRVSPKRQSRGHPVWMDTTECGTKSVKPKAIPH